jgi:hypothetical protein
MHIYVYYKKQADMTFHERIFLLVSFLRYNLKIIFSGRFFLFLLASWIFFLLMIGLMLFADVASDVNDVYEWLLMSGVLLMFYPVVFNVQNDKDARMLEIIFGVPDYRYKVYTLRFCMAILIMFVMLLIMSALTWLSVVQIPVIKMSYQLFFPLLFMACLTNLFVTIIKNANAAAVIMIVIGLIFLMMVEILRSSKWNLFLNPFDIPTDMNLSVWMNVVFQNRLILMIGSVIAFLWALINLQQREKFV